MTKENEPFTDEELERAEGDVLPDREVMSVVTGFDDPLPPSAVLDPLRGGEEL